MANFDEKVTAVDLLVPRCAQTFGAAPCQAAIGITGTDKCFNSRASCQDPSNYFAPDSQRVPIRFLRPQSGALIYGPARFSMEDLATTPASVNLGGMDRNSQALGRREVVSVDLNDHLDDDNQLDKYRLERESDFRGGVLILPGTAGNYASTPDSAALDITGDLDLRVWLSMDNWFPASNVGIIGKAQTAGQLSYGLNVNSAGNLFFRFTLDGTTLNGAGSDIAVGAANGAKKWVRATFQNGANFVMTFYVSDDGVTWTQQGAPQLLGGGPSPLFVSTSELAVGQLATGFAPGRLAGKVYYAEVRSGVDGPIVAAFNPNMGPRGFTLGAASFKASTGETWTVNGTAPQLFVPRKYKPYESGTFIGKFLARNPYHQGYDAIVYEGTQGQALADMHQRRYIVDRIEGPSEGAAKLVLKDLFSRVDSKKALAPLPSTGELAADITDVATSATLNPPGIGNLKYPASGNVVIGDEVSAFTRAGDVLTLTRAQMGTKASAHKDDDLVQLVLTFTSARPHEIAYQLLTSFALIDPAAIDKPAWDVAAAAITELYTVNIATPTAVQQLLGELCEQAGFTLYVDVTTGKIILAALRSVTPSPVVDDATWIIEGSLDLKRQDTKRATEVWTRYGQIDPTRDLRDENNYHSLAIVVDTDAESAQQFDGVAVREVFSRFIPQFARQFALNTGNRLLTMHRDPPLEATFAIHSSLVGQLSPTQVFTLRTADYQDFTGAPKDAAMAVIEIERDENECTIKAQGVTFFEATADVGERLVFIENDAANINLRTIYDTLYSGFVGVTAVTFQIESGVTISSNTAGVPALRTGTFPAGVTVTLANNGVIVGKAGDGGHGGGADVGINGLGGTNGSGAILAESPITIDNTSGSIWGGGGGGGGGGGAINSLNGVQTFSGGGGGGGGARLAGIHGAAGTPFPGGSYSPPFHPAFDGADGNSTTMAAGAGGEGELTNVGGGAAGYVGGFGGGGGAPGFDGVAGQAAPNQGFSSPLGAGGAAGLSGNYVTNNVNVTWLAFGDRKGRVS